jgi:hypothetical membrane protein
MLRKALLACGVVSSLLFVGADLLAAARYPDYHSFTSRAISELSAVGAPSRGLVEPLLIAYDFLIIAFGLGVGVSGRRRMRVVGGLLVAIGVLGLALAPFTPMRMRGTGSLATDAPHIAATAATVLCILLVVGLAAYSFGRGFRHYSHATLLILLVFGTWTGLEGARLAAGRPTPWLGLAERVHIGAYLAWVVVLAGTLWRPEARRQEVTTGAMSEDEGEPGERGLEGDGHLDGGQEAQGAAIDRSS